LHPKPENVFKVKLLVSQSPNELVLVKWSSTHTFRRRDVSPVMGNDFLQESAVWKPVDIIEVNSGNGGCCDLVTTLMKLRGALGLEREGRGWHFPSLIGLTAV